MSFINTNNTQLREVETKEELLTRWNNRLLAPTWQTSAIFLFFMPALISPLGTESVIYGILDFLWAFMIGKTIWSAIQWRKFKTRYQILYGTRLYVINGRKRALLKHFGLSFRDLLEFRINVIRYGLQSAVEIATGNPYSILNQPAPIDVSPRPVENIVPQNLPSPPFNPPMTSSYAPVFNLPVTGYDPDINDPRIDYLNSIDPFLSAIAEAL